MLKMSIYPLSKYNSFLICPKCNKLECYSYKLTLDAESLKCPNCYTIYPSIQGVPILEDDVAKDVFTIGYFDKISSYEDFVRRYEIYVNGDFHRSERVKFYYYHYPPIKADREAYLKSGYLAREKEFLRGFVQTYNITQICLEIGCAAGQFADISDNYIGLEYSLSAVFAKGFENYARIVASAESIPLADQSVELVFSFNTLEHIPNPELAFREIDRILIPKGWAILKPAWHCVKYNTEILPVRPYRELSISQKIRKFLIPLMRNKGFKFFTRVPVRIFRRISYFISQSPTELNYRKLKPYLGNDANLADADATADIDCHEGLLFFESRGYQVVSHQNWMNRLMAGNDTVVVQKPVL